MKLGLLTASLADMPAESVIARAAALGIHAVELAAWPEPLERDFTAAHVRVDDARSVRRVREALDTYGVAVAALAYYDNPLDADESRRRGVHRHLEAAIEAAAALGCPYVGTFVGRDPGRTVAENLRAAEGIFPRFIDLAGQANVKLMIENCAMHGWHPDGYPCNLAYSPELWDWVSELGLYLNFDPSHLPPLGISPVDALARHVERVVHMHAKDVTISRSARDRLSCYGRAIGRTDPWDTGWWSYRLPGEGEVDWRALIDVLDAAGFDGVVAIEHEDEEGPGTSESILGGVKQAADFLGQYLDGREGAGVPTRRGPDDT